MRVVPLFRVSTREQENRGASLDAQQRKYRELAAAFGWTTVAEFRGQESATRAATERLVLQRVLACIREQDVQALWCFEQSRLTRGDELEVALLLRELRERKVRVIVGTTEHDLSDPAHGLMVGIHASFDRYEAQRFRERADRGKREMAQQGRRGTGPPPLGYFNPPKGDPRRGVLQVDPETAPFIRRIFAAVASGLPVNALVEQLTAEGVRSPRGGRWTSTTLRRILANPAYYGCAEMHVWERVGSTLTYRKNLDNGRAVVIPDAHEPIVSREVWEVANRMRRGPSTRQNALLTGLLWIGGARQIVDYSSGVRYYRPAGEKGGAWVPAEAVQDAVWRGFVGIARRPAALAALLRRVAQSEQAEGESGPELEACARKLRARLDGLVRMRADDEIDKDTFASQSSETRGQIQQIEARLAAAARRQERVSLGAHEQAIAAAAVLVGKKLTVEQQRRLLRSLVARVDVSVSPGAPQLHASRGRWAKRAGPKWQLDSICLRLHRHLGPETIFSPWRRRPR